MDRTYRQKKEIMRVPRGPGRPDFVSIRPRTKDKHGKPIWKDSDEKPTLITFDEHCILTDLDFWLKIGAIVEYKPPKRVEYKPPAVKAKQTTPPIVRATKEVSPSGKGPGKS